MKKIIICSLLAMSLSISAQDSVQEILCAGTTNDGTLIELQVDLYTIQNRLIIEGQSFNLAKNNLYTIAWTNEVEDIRYENFLSKINGNMLVIAVDPKNTETSVRANLSCVNKKDRLFN